MYLFNYDLILSVFLHVSSRFVSVVSVVLLRFLRLLGHRLGVGFGFLGLSHWVRIWFRICFGLWLWLGCLNWFGTRRWRGGRPLWPCF